MYNRISRQAKAKLNPQRNKQKKWSALLIPFQECEALQSAIESPISSAGGVSATIHIFRPRVLSSDQIDVYRT